MATNVVNSPSAPVFTYLVYDGLGNQVPMTTVTGSAMQSILSVEIHVITDLNPGKSPNYFDLRTAAQPRNLRQQ